MSNKYLEKIAILGTVMGAVSADKGDKVGGAVSGFVGGNTAAIIGHRLAGVPGLIAGAAGGGYLSGKLYSKVKDGFRSEAAMKEHLKRNKK
jgi:hypothetical protein